MRVVFDVVETKATVKWIDPISGKQRQRTKKFLQTINPFNTDVLGQPKDREQIRNELNEQAWLWKLRIENDIRIGIFPE